MLSTDIDSLTPAQRAKNAAACNELVRGAAYALFPPVVATAVPADKSLLFTRRVSLWSAISVLSEGIMCFREGLIPPTWVLISASAFSMWHSLVEVDVSASWRGLRND